VGVKRAYRQTQYEHAVEQRHCYVVATEVHQQLGQPRQPHEPFAIEVGRVHGNHGLSVRGPSCVWLGHI
jgi:hypothetical protein